MKITKLLLVILTLALLLTGMTACKSEEENQDETDPNAGACDMVAVQNEIDSMRISDFEETNEVTDYVKFTVKDYGTFIVRLRKERIVRFGQAVRTHDRQRIVRLRKRRIVRFGVRLFLVQERVGRRQRRFRRVRGQRGGRFRRRFLRLQSSRAVRRLAFNRLAGFPRLNVRSEFFRVFFVFFRVRSLRRRFFVFRIAAEPAANSRE